MTIYSNGDDASTILSCYRISPLIRPADVKIQLRFNLHRRWHYYRLLIIENTTACSNNSVHNSVPCNNDISMKLVRDDFYIHNWKQILTHMVMKSVRDNLHTVSDY